MFARKGARLSSVEDILAAGGVSRRTFYRFFEGKDDVLFALYHVGTEGLLTACRLAVEQERDPMVRFERCIDVHLGNARVLSRLIFVLGGEAQHHESPLHARRMQVQAELCALITKGMAPTELDALVVRGLILALEGMVRLALQEGDEGRALSEPRLGQVKQVMMKLCADALRP